MDAIWVSTWMLSDPHMSISGLIPSEWILDAASSPWLRVALTRASAAFAWISSACIGTICERGNGWCNVL